MPPEVFDDFTPPEAWAGRQEAGTLWVAEADGEVVAFLGAHVEDDRLHIDEFAVAKVRQGQGLGRRMLTIAVDCARANGLAAVSLTTFRNVPFNGPFYAGFGFCDWPPEGAPAAIRERLISETDSGLKDRCAMRLAL